MPSYTYEEISQDLERLIELTESLPPTKVVGRNPEWCALADTLKEKVAYSPGLPPGIAETILHLIDAARSQRP